MISVVASRVELYGLAVTGTPEFLPSTWNCTLAMVRPAPAVALALSVTALPDTDKLAAGEVTDTAGGAAVEYRRFTGTYDVLGAPRTKTQGTTPS